MRDDHSREAILARFPGPVTLYVGWRKKLFALAMCLAFAAFMVWLVFNPRQRLLHPVWYDAMMTWVSLVVFAGMAIRGVFLLIWPRSASLTLDADGFEIGKVFWRNRASWRVAENFRIDKSRTGYLTVIYDLLKPGALSGTVASDSKLLPDNYGLTKEDLAALLNAWRERALAQAPVKRGSVPRVRAAD